MEPWVIGLRVLETGFLDLTGGGGVVVVDAGIGVGEGSINLFVERDVVAEVPVNAGDGGVVLNVAVAMRNN